MSGSKEVIKQVTKEKLVFYFFFVYDLDGGKRIKKHSNFVSVITLLATYLRLVFFSLVLALSFQNPPRHTRHAAVKERCCVG